MPSTTRLPREETAPTLPARVAVPWGAALALVIAANLAFGWVLEHRPLSSDWLVRQKWRMLLAGEGRAPVDTLVLGDSSGNQSVDPRILSEVLGGSALNLCTIGTMGTVDDAWMLSEYLLRVGAPRRVVVVHSFDVWPRAEREQLTGFMQEIPLPGRFWERFEPRIDPPRGQRSRRWLGRVLPLYGHNLSAAKLIANPRRLFAPAWFSLTPEGFMPMGAERARPAGVEREAEAFARRAAAFSISGQNRAALERLRDLAEERGIDLFLATCPTNERIVSAPGGARYIAGQRAFLEQLAAASPRAHVVLPDPLLFPAREMEQWDHLVGDAPARYTRALAEAIRAARAP